MVKYNKRKRSYKRKRKYLSKAKRYNKKRKFTKKKVAFKPSFKATSSRRQYAHAVGRLFKYFHQCNQDYIETNLPPSVPGDDAQQILL